MQKKQLKRTNPKKNQIKYRFFIFLFLLLSIIVFIALRHGSGETILITKTVQHDKKLKGKGVFIYNEIAPDFLLNKNFSTSRSESKNEFMRLRIKDQLFKLGASEKKNLEKELNEKHEISKLNTSQKLEIQYLSDMLESNTVFAPFSCMVINERDGYEKILQVEDLNSWQPGDVPNPLKLISKKGIKFVDNRLYYLAVDLPQTHDPHNFEMDQLYSIDNDKVKTNATLERSVTNKNGQQLLIFSLRNNFEDFITQRFNDINITISSEQCYILPESTVFEENQKNYCYVLDDDNVCEKVEVDIVDYDDTNHQLIVSAGKNSDLNSGNGKKLSLYDRVVQDPSRVKEGKMY